MHVELLGVDVRRPSSGPTTARSTVGPLSPPPPARSSTPATRRRRRHAACDVGNTAAPRRPPPSACGRRRRRRRRRHPPTPTRAGPRPSAPRVSARTARSARWPRRLATPPRRRQGAERRARAARAATGWRRTCPARPAARRAAARRRREQGDVSFVARPWRVSTGCSRGLVDDPPWTCASRAAAAPDAIGSGPRALRRRRLSAADRRFAGGRRFAASRRAAQVRTTLLGRPAGSSCYCMSTAPPTVTECERPPLARIFLRNVTREKIILTRRPASISRPAAPCLLMSD